MTKTKAKLQKQIDELLFEIDKLQGQINDRYECVHSIDEYIEFLETAPCYYDVVVTVYEDEDDDYGKRYVANSIYQNDKDKVIEIEICPYENIRTTFFNYGNDDDD